MTSERLFRDWLSEKPQGLAFQAESEKLEPAHQVGRLRILQRLTQAELAAPKLGFSVPFRIRCSGHARLYGFRCIRGRNVYTSSASARRNT